MKIVFNTGSGISKESGIPTFRGESDSMWENVDVDIVASTKGLHNNFEELLHFHNELRNLMNKCEPNDCHKFIADLEKDHDVTVVTSNIDELHEKAGSSKVIHVHGNIFEACDMNKEESYWYNQDIKVGDTHPLTGVQLRPNTVLFGEMLSADCYSINHNIVEKADILIIIGTSLSVFPSSEIMYYNKNIIYLDPNAKDILGKGWKLINKTACQGIDDLKQLIYDKSNGNT